MRRMDLVKDENGWKTESNGRTVAGTRADTKEQAIKQAAEKANALPEPVTLKIHKENGRIQEERTYPVKADPRSSKG